MSDYAQASAGHRTTYGHFLAKGKWNDVQLEETQKHENFLAVKKESKEKSSVVYISSQNKPSSRAKRPMQGGRNSC